MKTGLELEQCVISVREDHSGFGALGGNVVEGGKQCSSVMRNYCRGNGCGNCRADCGIVEHERGKE